MTVRPPPVPGTGYSTADPMKECPVEAVATSITRPASLRRIWQLCYSSASSNHSVIPNHSKMPNEMLTAPASDIDTTVAAFTRLMDRMAADHQPPADAGISMAQLRCLHLIAGAGELRMSRLVAQLGVSISTVSGLIDRLVDHGFVSRRDDPLDRRQVVLSPTPAGIEFLDRMRELSNAQFRGLISHLTPEELRTVHRSIEILSEAADRARVSSTADPGKDPR